MKLLHELLEQIVEEYKNSREKSMQIIPKDIHIKKWEKFSVEYQLKFLNSWKLCPYQKESQSKISKKSYFYFFVSYFILSFGLNIQTRLLFLFD